MRVEKWARLRHFTGDPLNLRHIIHLRYAAVSEWVAWLEGTLYVRRQHCQNLERWQSGMMTTTACLVDGGAPLSIRRHVKRSLVSTGMKVRVCTLDRPLLERQLEEPCDVYVVNLIHLNEDQHVTLQWLLDQLRASEQRAKVVMICAGNNEHVRSTLGDEALPNMLLFARNEVGELQLDERQLIASYSKLPDRDIFGLERCFPARGVAIKEKSVASTEDRAAALEELEDYLGTIECPKYVEAEILMVADELLTNAIFNAPHDAEGKARYRHLSRNSQLVLQPEERVQLRYGCDGLHVWLAVSDPFGRLERKTIAKYLVPHVSGGNTAVRSEGVGAGLGLVISFSMSTQLTFNIIAGERTEVIASFYISKGMRAFRAAGNSLGLCLR